MIQIWRRHWRFMAHTEKPRKDQPTRADGYERSDARFMAVLFSTLLIMGASVLLAFAIFFFYRYYIGRMERSDKPVSPLMVGQKRPLPQEPRLQMSPKADMDIFL